MRRLLLVLALLTASLSATVNCNNGAAGVPVISAPAVSNITTSGFTVTWTTDIAATSQVGYGEYVDYGFQTAETDTASGVTSHSVAISNIFGNAADGNGWYYMIKSRAVVANVIQTTKLDCYEVTSTVTLATPSTSGTPDFYMQIYGGKTVTQGNDIYFIIKSGWLSGSANATAGNDSYVVTGFPVGSTIHWPDREFNGLIQGSISTTNVANDTFNWFQSVQDTNLQVTIPANATVGAYTITVTTTVPIAAGGSTVHNATIPITVAAPTTIARTPPTNTPAIPNLATFNSWAQTYGTLWGNSTCAMTNNSDPCVTYYDGLGSYYQLADYLGNATYLGYARQAMYEYRDIYAITGQSTTASSSGVSAFHIYAEGLYTSAAKYNDPSSKTVLQGLATVKGSLLHGYYNYTNSLQREPALVLDAMRLDQKFGHDHSAIISELVSVCLQSLQETMDGVDLTMEPFMAGLTAEMLERYYDDGNQSDIRIPATLKAFADWLYTNAYGLDNSAGGFYYDSSRNALGLQANFYNNGTLDASSNDLRLLNMLIVHLYAWVWRYTGNSTYQTEFDTIWNAVVASSWSPTGNLDFAGNGGKQTAQFLHGGLYAVQLRGSTPTTTTSGASMSGGSVSVP